MAASPRGSEAEESPHADALPAFTPMPSELGPPRLPAVRIHAPPRIDGRLDDAAWATTPGEDHFTQQLPYGGHPPSDRTVVKVLYDDEAVYIGMDCEQLHSPVLGRLTRRDEDSESDSVWIYLDSRRDGRFATFFSVNVAGVMFDGTLHDGSTFSTEWDENWEGRAAVTAKGWSAELRIPLRVLRYATGLPIQDWGIWVSRFIAARQERNDWPYIARDVAAPIAVFGRLDNLRDLPQPSRLEIRPFGVARLRRIDANPDVLAHGWSGGLDGEGFSAGVDMKLHLTQSMTADLSITPDFAQVEADQLVFNVTNYEIQFPEKRALFLEGADQYLTPLSLFYSRRIGRSPLTPTLKSGTGVPQPTDGTLVDFPAAATLYAAAKIGGRVSDAWTFELLTSLAARNRYDVQLASLVRQSRIVEPLTAFNVFRLRRDIGRNAQLGFLGTATTRFEDTAGDRTCPTGQPVANGARCFRDAYVGGIDGLTRFGEDFKYVLAGQVAASAIQNGQVETQLDGTPIGAGSGGGADGPASRRTAERTSSRSSCIPA